jgi:hypothetical protein
MPNCGILAGTARHTARASSDSKRIDFAKVNAAALTALHSLLARWLPGGTRRRDEYVVLNPRRADRHAGSFRINLRSGKWADFATADRGRDVVGLYAFLNGIDQVQAAIAVARTVGIDPYARGGGSCRRR